MEIFLVRHGHAVDKAFNSGRPLSEQGKMEIQILSERIKEESLIPSKIYHSTILRAEQTASILAENLNLNRERYSHKKLSGDHDFEFWKKFYLEKQESIMLVGHNPFMQLFAEYLLPVNTFNFQTGSCLCLKSEQEEFIFKWSYSRSIHSF